MGFEDKKDYLFFFWVGGGGCLRICSLSCLCFLCVFLEAEG